MHGVIEAARSNATEKIDARFIEGPNGPLFCLAASSENSGHVSGVSDARALRIGGKNEVGGHHIVLFVPPFGEEINLCRRFNSLLRTHLSMEGFYSVQPDLYGTGDSCGNFEDATWEMWQSDLECVVEKFCLSKKENVAANRLSIVAVRAGCLLTQQLLASPLFLDSRIELENIVFIQPELNGFDIVNRLFRARITAQRFSGNKTQTSKDLWACIERGETVNAGGHALSSKLCKVLQDARLELGTPTRFRRQALFTLEPGTDNQESAGWEVNNLAAKPFWQSYYVEPESALISAIAEAIER